MTKAESAVANFRAFLDAASTPEHNERYIDEIEGHMLAYAETLDEDTKIIYLTRGLAALQYVRAELKEARDAAATSA